MIDINEKVYERLRPYFETTAKKCVKAVIDNSEDEIKKSLMENLSLKEDEIVELLKSKVTPNQLLHILYLIIDTKVSEADNLPVVQDNGIDRDVLRSIAGILKIWGNRETIKDIQGRIENNGVKFR